MYNISMPAKEQIKILLAKEDMKMTKLAELLTEKLGKKMTLSNLSYKLTRGTLHFNEAEAIGEILGYKLEFIKEN